MQRWPAGLAATSVLLSVFFVALGLPIPDKTVAAKTLMLASHRVPHAIAITGNSVLSHTSRCDADRSTLAELLKRALGPGLLNLGAPGQHFSESANYLALALRQDNVDSAVWLMAPYQLGEHDWPSLQTQVFMSARASASLQANSFPARFAEGYALSGGAPGSTAGFSYKGVSYPDYDGLKLYFAREKAAMGCPENLGQQRAFIEAAYYRQFVAAPDLDSNAQDLASLSSLARSLGKRFLVVLLPADIEDVRQLDPELALAIEAHLRAVSERLQQLGVASLDLTRSPSVHDFADRWCACGHLSEQGRKWVSERVATHLAASQSKPTLPAGSQE